MSKNELFSLDLMGDFAVDIDMRKFRKKAAPISY